MKKILAEFKDFAVKGNAIDLAVGVIIGGAFGKIVTSLVNDVIMPLVGIVLGGVDLSGLNLTIQNIGKDPVIFAYGKFLQNIVDFLIIAVCIFVIVKLITNVQKKVIKKAEADSKKPEPKTETELDVLNDIRNLLKKSQNPKKTASKKK